MSSSSSRAVQRTEAKMTIKQKLQNPFALIAQGFIAGAILFWATGTGGSDAPTANPPVESAQAAGDVSV